MLESIIKIENLKKSYGSVKALKGIDLEVKKGELFSLLGPNGAGKTTTIRIINGLTKRDSGNVYIKGIDIFKEQLKSKRLMGLVPQTINLDVDLTIRENLLIHGLLYSMSMKDIKRRTEELLEYIGLIDRIDDKVKNLSGGMRRRLLIARALLHSPEVLFLDEPTAGLDPNIRRKIWWLIKKIQKEGTTIFMTTHYIEEAEFLADRVAFIDLGQIVEVDTPKNFIQKLGEWAVDIIEEDRMKTLFFNSKEEIKNIWKEEYSKLNIRRVNLEDVFLTLTGKRVKDED